MFGILWQYSDSPPPNSRITLANADNGASPKKIHTSVTFVDLSNLSLSAFLEPYRSYMVGVSARWENKKHHVKI